MLHLLVSAFEKARMHDSGAVLFRNDDACNSTANQETVAKGKSRWAVPSLRPPLRDRPSESPMGEVGAWDA
jgi:hypothetical protein